MKSQEANLGTSFPDIMNHHLLIIIAVVIALTVKANGQTLPSGSWADMIRRDTVIETVEQLRAGMQWPVIVSSYRANLMADQERVEMRQRIDAAGNLLEKVNATFASKEPASQDELQSDMKLLLELSEEAKTAGGYTNLVLADSLNRLVIYLVASWLVVHPGDARFCAKLLSAWPIISPNYIDVLQLTICDDNQLVSKNLDFSKVNPKDSIFQSLIVIGISQSDVLASMGSGVAKTSILFKQPSALALASRTAETAALRNVYLAGFIAFLEKGGTIIELNASDVTAFERRMGKGVRDYKCPEFGIRRLSVDHLLALIELKKSQSTGVYFLSAALE